MTELNIAEVDLYELLEIEFGSSLNDVSYYCSKVL